MFRTDDNFFDAVSLRNEDYVTSATFVFDRADLAVETFMRHALLSARIHLDYHLGPRRVALEVAF